MNKSDAVGARGRGAIIGAIALALTAWVGAAWAADVKVTIADMSFGQIPADLKVGDTITWVNDDTVPHTVTARDHSFDLRVNAGRSVQMKLDTAGTFPFYCDYHTAMRGVLEVKGN